MPTARPPLRLDSLDASGYALPAELLERLVSPALVIFLPKVRHNLATMMGLLGGDPNRWRPHLKTTKTPEIYAECLTAGLRQFKCATVREARCMLEVARSMHIGQIDVLMAYAYQGPSLAMASDLAKYFPGAKLSVLSETPEHAASVPPNLGVFVDVNPGMNRTGIPLAEQGKVLDVATKAKERFRGVHFYDGHIHHDTQHGRRAAAHALYRQLIDLVAALTTAVGSCPEAITSGTPTFQYALDFPEFSAEAVGETPCRHEISPGTVIFHDAQYDELLEDLLLEPAALVLSRVISHPNRGIVTCDAGSKSIACEAGSPVAVALGQPGLQALSPSEEHLPFAVENIEPPDYGTPVLLVPRHVCPTVNLAESAVLIDGDAWRSVKVAARAHDLLKD